MIPVLPERNGLRALVRACTAAAIGALDKTPATRVAERIYSSERTVEWLLRAPSLITDTANAPALIHTVLPELLTALTPVSAAAQIFAAGLRLNYDHMTVPTVFGDAAYSTFVAEGFPIPVVQMNVEPPIALAPKKLASVIVLTTEMVRSSNVEALMTDALLRSTGLALDNALLDDQPADAARPVGLRHNIPASVASPAPDPTAALMQDIETVCRAAMLHSAYTPFLVMSRIRGLMAELRSHHGLAPLRVIGSRALRGTMIMMAIAPDFLVSALGTVPEISATREGALQMTSTPDTGPLTYSVWQTDSVAILVKLPVTWGLREASGVAWLQTTNW